MVTTFVLSDQNLFFDVFNAFEAFFFKVVEWKVIDYGSLMGLTGYSWNDWTGWHLLYYVKNYDKLVLNLKSTRWEWRIFNIEHCQVVT